MNITFLIGNGFDINLGLKTSYRNFYKYYLEKDRSGILAKGIAEKPREYWADLEVALGALTSEITVDDSQQYLNEKEELERELAEYLRRQQDKMKLNIRAIQNEFERKITSFYEEFSALDKGQFLIWRENVLESIRYQFVSFNYTNTLDRIVEQIPNKRHFGTHDTTETVFYDAVGSVLHVHGTLNNNMILGVDSEEQILNQDLQTQSQWTRYMIKARVNERLGTQNIETAIEILNCSDYVCIYGMSLGPTDEMWWKYLMEWIKKKEERRIVLYAYESRGDSLLGEERLRKQDEWRSKLLTVAKVNDEDKTYIEEKIIVLICSKIFSFNL